MFGKQSGAALLVAATLLAALSIGTQVSAATYYVRKSGNDNFNGRTLLTAFKTIKKAAAVVLAGDTVYVGAGNFAEDFVISRDGTSTDPIAFIADKSGAKTGLACTVKISAKVQVRGNYVLLQDFEMSDSGEVFRSEDAVGGLLQGCIISSGNPGVKLKNTEITLNNCTISQCDGDGIRLEGRTVVEVNQCTISKCDDDGIDCPNNGVMIVRETTIRECVGNGLEADKDSKGLILLDRCRILANRQNGIFTGKRAVSVICNSLLARNLKAGFNLDTGGTTVDESALVWHCTISNNGTHGVGNRGHKVVLLWDNIITYNAYSAIEDTRSTIEESNLFYGNASGDAAVAVGTNITGNPKFVWSNTEDYRIGLGSPAMDRARDLVLGYNDFDEFQLPSVDVDIDGISRPSGVESDLGCYELVNTAGDIYYVRTDGNDTRTGRTPSKAFRTITKAASVVNPGDMVYIGGGTYREAPSLTRAGSESKPIRFIGDITGAKTGKGGTVVLSPPAANTISMSVNGAHYTEFELLRFSAADYSYNTTPGPTYSVSNGIAAANTASLTFTNCEFDHFSQGLQADYSGVKLIGTKFHDIYAYPQMSFGGAIIDNCDFFNSGNGPYGNRNHYFLMKNSRIVDNSGWALMISPKSSGDSKPFGVNTPRLESCVLDRNGGGLYWAEADENDRMSFSNTRFTNVGSEINLVNCNMTVTNAWRSLWPIDKGTNGILTQNGNLTFDGFLAEGYKSGWGLLASYGNVVVKNSVFRDCDAGVGFYYPTSLDLRDTSITDNRGSGGGVSWGLKLWNKADNPPNSTQITNCTITNNANGAWFAGLNDATVKLTNTTVTNNTGIGLQFHMSDVKFTPLTMGTRWIIASNGTGIVANYGKTLFDSITMADNTSWNAGTNFGEVTVRNCSFKGAGSGFYSNYNKSFVAENTQFSNNTGNWGLSYTSNGTYYDGTSWVSTTGTDQVTNCVIENNRNGLYLGNVRDNRVLFVNSPIRNNVGSGLYAEGGELAFNASTVGSQWQLSGNGTGITTYYGKFLFSGITLADNKNWGAETNYGEITVQNCRFTRNPTGGFRSNFNKSFRAENSTFDVNGTWGVAYSSDGRYYSVINGAGQWNTGATPGEFRNCIIEKNDSGLYLGNCTDGTLLIVNTPIRSNTTNGLYVENSEMSFTAATVGTKWLLSDNGNGIRTSYGKILFDGIELADNKSWAAVTYWGDVTVKNCRFTRNAEGGLQSYYNKSFTAENSRFDNNGQWGVSYYSDGRYYGNVDGEWKWATGATPGEFKNCFIENNNSGMYLSDSIDNALRMTDTPIRGNTRYGLYAIRSDLSFTTATVGSKWILTDNGNSITAYYGKTRFDGVTISGARSWGVLTRYGEVTANNCTFTGNSEGGFQSYYDKSFVADNCHFDANGIWGLGFHSDGTYYGVANGTWDWRSDAAPGRITNSTISRNQSNGMYVSDVTDERLQISATTIRDNGGVGVSFYDSKISITPETKDMWLVTNNARGFFASGSNLTVDGFEITGNSEWGLYAAYSNVTLKNSRFYGNGNNVCTYVEPWVEGSDGTTTIENCRFENSTKNYGLLLYYGNASVKNSTFAGNAGDGLQAIYNKSLSVDGCTFENNKGWGTKFNVNRMQDGSWEHEALFANNIQTMNNCTVDANANGIYAYNAKNANFSVKNTRIQDNQAHSLRFDQCQYVWNTQTADSVTLKDNGNGPSGAGSTLDLVLQNVKAEGCKSYGLMASDGKFRAENCQITGPNCVGFYSVRNTKTELSNCRFDGGPRSSDGWGWAALTYGSSPEVRNCVFNGYPNGAYAYTYGNESVTPSPKFFNNTFANLSTWGFYLPNGQAEVRNNIFAGKAGNRSGYGLVRAGGMLTHSHNLVSGFGSAYQNTQGTDNDVLNNPRFANVATGDLRLAAGSPAINAGTDVVRGMVDYDMDGNPRPAFRRWEIGAFEYMSSAGSVRVLNWSEKK